MAIFHCYVSSQWGLIFFSQLGSSTSRTTCESLVLSGWHPRLQGAHRCLSQQVNLVTEGVIHHAESPPQVMEGHPIPPQRPPRQAATGCDRRPANVYRVYTLSPSEVCGECAAVWFWSATLQKQRSFRFGNKFPSFQEERGNTMKPFFHIFPTRSRSQYWRLAIKLDCPVQCSHLSWGQAQGGP